MKSQTKIFAGMILFFVLAGCANTVIKDPAQKKGLENQPETGQPENKNLEIPPEYSADGFPAIDALPKPETGQGEPVNDNLPNGPDAAPPEDDGLEPGLPEDDGEGQNEPNQGNQNNALPPEYLPGYGLS